MVFSDVKTLVSSRNVSSGSMAVSRCSSRLRLNRKSKADSAITETAYEKKGMSGKCSCQWRKGDKPMFTRPRILARSNASIQTRSCFWKSLIRCKP